MSRSWRLFCFYPIWSVALSCTACTRITVQCCYRVVRQQNKRVLLYMVNANELYHWIKMGIGENRICITTTTISHQIAYRSLLDIYCLSFFCLWLSSLITLSIPHSSILGIRTAQFNKAPSRPYLGTGVKKQCCVDSITHQ